MVCDYLVASVNRTVTLERPVSEMLVMVSGKLRKQIDQNRTPYSILASWVSVQLHSRSPNVRSRRSTL